MKATLEELVEKSGLAYSQVSAGIKLMKHLELAREVDKIVAEGKKGRRKIVFEIDTKEEDSNDDPS